MTRERRIHARVRAQIRGALRLSTTGELLEGVIENVGDGGVFFATEILEVLVTDGDRAIVEFTGERNGAPVALQIPSTILRTERYFDGQRVVRAFAIQFQESHDFTDVTFGE